MTTLRPRRRQGPTQAQQRVLRALVAGQSLEAGPYGFRLTGGAPVRDGVVNALFLNNWISAPLPALPLLNVPACPGAITDAGKAALSWSVK